MSIRKPTLSEWFLAYQLRSIQRNHVFNPIYLEVDISALETRYREANKEPRYTSILIKAMALVAKQHPIINRVWFSRFWGDRLLSLPYINVNFPHYIEEDGRQYLIASVVPAADEKTVDEISDIIKKSCQKSLKETIIAKHFRKNKNTFLMRLYLRIIHFLAYSFPGLYLRKGGGGLSVSSLLNHAEEGFRCTPFAWGPTAMTVSSCSVTDESDGRRVMRIGLSWDHLTGEGNEMVKSVKTLSKILQGQDQEALEQLI
ncbi:MAG: 2-oxo acid dehydrogenase subunit E2 [Myxococcota bacterium]|nr:2-oxo acid dehydrogenase subunit E2 [Myxococcota bacterium]